VGQFFKLTHSKKKRPSAGIPTGVICFLFQPSGDFGLSQKIDLFWDQRQIPNTQNGTNGPADFEKWMRVPGLHNPCKSSGLKNSGLTLIHGKYFLIKEAIFHF